MAPNRLLAISIACLAIGVTGVVPAQGLPAPEYQVKALFLFNFTSFVDWPADAFPDETSPVVIGILGEDVFGPYLAEAVGNERVKGRPLVLRTYRRVEEIDTCHVLFISPSENDRLGAILAALKSRSILTVGESEGFASRGGMIRFVIEEHKIRLRINLAAAQSAKLTLSSKLLRLAEIVGPRD